MTQRKAAAPYSEAESAVILAAAIDDDTVGKDKWTAVAEKLGTGRTWRACRQQSLILRRKAEAAGPPQKRAYAQMQEPPASLPQPASITAALFGDPLPGRSALDQMRAGLT